MKAILSLAAVLSAAVLFAGELVLTDKGKPNSVIVMDDASSPYEKLAAKEITAYVKKISGADLQTAKNGKVRIELVTLEKSRKNLPSDVIKKLEKANKEAYCVQSAPGKVIIAGKTTAGVLQGTYAFLEDILGVRFFHAQAESVPVNPTIRVRDFRIFRQPWLKLRRLNVWRESIPPFTPDETLIWMNRRGYTWDTKRFDRNRNVYLKRMQDYVPCENEVVRDGGHMTFENSVPGSLFKTRPELFPLQGGKRVYNKEHSQRCLSNPEVQKMVTDYVVSRCRKGIRFDFGFRDSKKGWCECEPCRKMGLDAKGNFSVPNYAHTFIRTIAARVLKICPKANLTYDIYLDFRELPTISGFKHPEELIGCYCPHGRCYVHTLENSECNAQLYKLWKDWMKISPKQEIFDYYCYSETDYCPTEYVMAKDMKLYHSLGLIGFIEDTSHAGRSQMLTNWPFYYLMSKLYWDVNLDVEKVMEDAYTRYYGPAAKPMKEYQAYRRQLWESVPGHSTYPGAKRYAGCLLVPGMEKRLLGLLDQAEKLAANDKEVLRRIQWDRTYLNRFWIKEAHKILANSKGKKDIPVSRTSGKFVIDGKLNEDAWRSASILTGFLNTENKAEAKEETRVRILYDDQYWYIGIEAMTEHPWGPLLAKHTKHDSEIWEDDCVEIFMVPPQDSYYQWVVNSLGAFYDAKGYSSAFESKAEVKAVRSKDRYTVEMKIPASCMGRKSIQEGEAWKLHFTRGARNLQPPADVDYSAVDGVEPHDYMNYRSAALGIEVARNGSFSKLVKVPEDRKKSRRITSDQLPEFWSVFNGGLKQDKNGKNIISNNNNYIFTYLQYRRGARKTVLSGFAEVSGKGSVTIYFTGCIRKPGDKRGYKDEFTRTVATVKLTDKLQIIPIRYEAPPYSEHYLNFKSNSVFNLHRVVLSR